MDELEKAINLLEDKNLVWSEDFDTIRLELTQLMRKAADVQYHKLEAELDALAKSVSNEGSNNARRTRTTKKDSSVQS
jgi:hypothetical protein